jgi:quercetin dioxygenase-like cupin family protein
LNGKKLTIALLFIVEGIVALAANQDIEITNLERTPTYSVHRVRVRTQEIPHYHAWHDSAVLLKQGGGILYMNGKAYPLKPGDRINIPRNVPHYFVHTATTPYSEAEVVFSPPFDGADRVPVDANAVYEKKPGWRTQIARALERFFEVVTLSFVF